MAPGILIPFRFHWKASGGAPAAVTLNVAGWPTPTFWLLGWVVIAGA